jgi:outer membrane protein assembly factor BamB
MISRFHKQAFVLALIAAFSGCSATPKGETTGWIKWRGPSGNGTIVDASFNPRFAETKDAILWKATVDGGYSGLAVTDSRVYTIGSAKKSGKNVLTAYCLDSATGKAVWTAPFEVARNYQYPGPRSMPVLSGGRLYFVGSGGEAFCLNQENGKKIWSRDLLSEEKLEDNTWGVASSAVIVDGKVLLNVGGGIALDPANGKTLWKGPAMKNGYATPVVFEKGGELRAMVFSGECLLMLRVSDGKEIARFAWDNAYDVNAADPVVFPNQTVLISSTYRSVGCALLDFSADSFREVWSGPSIGTHFSSFIEHDGLIFGIDGDTNERMRCAFVCMDPATGKTLWSEKTAIYGSLIKVNNTIAYLDENGRLSAVEPTAEGYRHGPALAVLTGRNNSWVAPSYWNGKFYLRNNAGEVACVKAN